MSNMSSSSSSPVVLFALVAIFLPLSFLPVQNRAEPEPKRRGSGKSVADDKLLGRLQQPITDFDKKKTADDSSGRYGKLFSLFTVVNFRNSACSSQTTLTGSTRNRNGTCYSVNDCSSAGGTASGGCAAGFGVCCIFIVTDGTITQNCTYIQNSNFPASETTGASYTIQKCRADVCFLRLDFETFDILGTGQTADGDCLDMMDVTAGPTQNIPSICGLNTGQHIYVDIGNQPGDTATITFTLDPGNTGTRVWDIKVTQVECSNPAAPDDGCLQYLTGVTGRIETFNYADAADNHANNQQYTVCIRPEEGYCCVQFQVCPDQGTAGFSPDNANMGNVDAACTNDYIGIPGTNDSGSGGTCDTTSTATSTKFCGNFLSPIPASTANIPVCDCQEPFTVEVFFDGLADNGGVAGIVSRGVCLQYTQIPC